MKTAIIGATGYGGAELLRILNHHPEVHVHSLHSSSQQGKQIGESYPHLQEEAPYQLQDIDPSSLAKEVDVVFIAAPSGVSSKIAPELLEEGLKVIDLSGDFRLKNRDDYTKWYKNDPAEPKWLDHAVYGLTEWAKSDVQNAKLIANPGCYPTAVLLGLAPLVSHSIIDESSIVIDAKSGVTGAGRTPSSVTHYAEMNDNFKIYKVNQHQHIPEIEQTLKGWNNKISPITFSTHLVPMTRGIMATIYANVKDGITYHDIRSLFEESYNDAAFVRVRKEGEFPSTKEVYGSNYCDLSFALDERTGRITVVSVIDNLMKGAAGQAVQNLNVMLDVNEKTGLNFLPVFP
jgi:N-acetyl-gamma-glutamyl-phosphate reductase